MDAHSPSPQPQKKKPATKQQIERELKLIYQTEEDGGRPDLKTFNRAKRKRRWPKIIIIAAVLFGLAWVAWAGIMRFGGSVRYGDSVVLAIEGPEAPRAGEAGTWTIRYKNNERLPLARAAVSLNLPPSIALISSDPALPDPKSLSWTIGALNAGDGGSITVKGRVLDAVDAPLAAQTTLSYRPANFNADFQKVANWSSRVADSAVVSSLTGPDEAVPGDEQVFTLTVSRQEGLSDEAAIPDLRIRFDPDQLIVIKKAEPDFSANDARTWLAAAPETGKSLAFAVTGAFAANTSGNQTIRAEVGTMDASGNFLLLAPATAAVSVLPGDLSLTLIRNGSTSDGTVGLGGSLHISVDYENKSQKTIKDAEISLTIFGNPSEEETGTVDWATLDDLRDGKRDGDTITWTKKQVPELALIAPGEKGSIDLSVKAVASVFTTGDRAYGIDLSARGLIGSFGDKKSGKTVATPVMRTLINSDAAVSAATALVGGTLQAGQTATYRVVWVLTNKLHQINGIKIAAPLAPGVSFAQTGQAGAGDPPYYDKSANAVIWTLNYLPTSTPSVSVDFTVNVTPAAGDAGKILPLIDDTILTATDKDTNASLAGDAAPLDTSDAQGDDSYSGKVAP